MGAWGTGVKDNDTSSDLYDDFFELYEQGLKPPDISKKLIAENQELINTRHDCNNFWFTLALAQWEIKSLDPEIHQKVKDIVESKQDIQIWKELEADDKTLRKRQNDLEKFLTKISVEKIKPKSKSKPAKPIFYTGDCLTFKFRNGFFGGVLILAAENKYGYNLAATTRINQLAKPTITDFYKAQVLFATFGNYKDEAKLTWFIPGQYKRYADGLFERVGQLEVKKKYDPNSLTPKATYSGGWHMLVEIAEKQFEYEEINGKSQKRLSITELIKNKPFWKFW